LSPGRAALLAALVVAAFIALSILVHPIAAVGLAVAALLLTVFALHGR
jgi:hypothetical protein